MLLRTEHQFAAGPVEKLRTLRWRGLLGFDQE
jgi:hypothetical protein